MLPKSKMHYYIGYEEGLKSIKYYNAETKTILTSQNFHFLPPKTNTPPEQIEITPHTAIQREGEAGPAETTMSNTQKHVRDDEIGTEGESEPPRKL
jgi:hypothetical protein